MKRAMGFILLFAASQLLAQSSLRGKVDNQKSHAEIAAANIFMPEIKRGGVTDQAGSYEIKGLPQGEIKVQVSHVGYKTEIQTVQIREGVNELNVMLTPAAIEAEEILVTATTYTAPEQTAYNIHALNLDELKTSGTVTLTDELAEAPGMSQLSTGTGIAKPVIRGLYGNRILTVINGFRFDNQQWQDEHGLGLSDIGVGKIEIVKGPASLLYGSDALGGVINLLDEKPAPFGRTVGDYNLRIYSNTLAAATEVGLRGANESLNWSARLGGQSHADYLDGNGARVPNTRFMGLDLKSNLGFIRKNFISNWNYHFSLYQFGIVELEELAKPKPESHFERGIEGPHHAVNYQLLTTQNTFFLGRAKLEVDAGAHLNTRKEEEGKEEQSTLGDLDMQLNTFSLSPKLRLPVAANTEVTTGLQATAQTNTNHGARVIIPDANVQELSPYGFLKHTFNRLVIEEGLRYNLYHLKTDARGNPGAVGYMPALAINYHTVDGSIGFAYRLTDAFLLKTNFASGYRAPNLAELSSNGLHEGTLNYEIGDAALKNEKNFEIDLSARYATAAFALEAAVFRDHFDDYIYLAPTMEQIQGFRVYRFLQAEANLQGLEASLDWIPPRIGWMGFRSSFSKVMGKRADGGYLPLMPGDKWSSEVKATSRRATPLRDGYLKLTVTKVFSQDNLAPTENASPGYTLVDIAVGGNAPLLGRQTDLTLVCRNLFSTVYYDHLSRLKPGSFNDPTIGFNNSGRNICLYVGFPFDLK